MALLHFALRHCLRHGKKRIIIVLPFLTLAEQNAATYAKIIPNVLVDHSQSGLPEDARELAARWSAPVIITTDNSALWRVSSDGAKTEKVFG